MSALIELAYLVAAALFILGLKRLSSPATAPAGNRLSAVGMLIAIVATALDRQIVGFGGILIGGLIGSGLGLWMARTVQMTAMPQMVGILNGFGGGASLLVSAGEWHRLIQPHTPPLTLDTAVSVYASLLVGGVTFSGSMVAAAKLQELISGRAVVFRGQHALNLVLFLAFLGGAGYLIAAPNNPPVFLALAALCLLLGVLLVIPIGGADMPVVVSLLNSYSGVAAAMTGFVIKNHGLIITGALVGASGIILTQIMCRAMNRSLANVLFGGFGATAVAAGGDARSVAGKTVRQIAAADAATMLAYARQVVIAPGYGLAVAQAQHLVRELADMLEKRGVQVKYAIHPVAGRMPGHMNVLLAEANVPYPLLYDMDSINPEFERTDVVLVVGANDVVNPAARDVPSSPLYGMPILEVDKAQNIIVLKRSMNPGFAGIENDLFYSPKTFMLFGNAKESVQQLITELKAA
jgi:NAD(P) transhydrogenase subunit beta